MSRFENNVSLIGERAAELIAADQGVKLPES
jgi:hypothetical protein